MKINILYLGHKYNTTQISATGVGRVTIKKHSRKVAGQQLAERGESLPR